MEADRESVVAARGYYSFDLGLKRRRRSRVGRYKSKEAVDRISSLPDALLVQILSLQKTKDAVKTGTLSKRWQYLWTSSPVLDFVPKHPQFLNSLDKLSHIVSRIDNILVLHESVKITKFSFICLYDHVDGYSSSVHLWLRFVKRTNVEILELSLPPIRISGVRYVLPQHFYDNSSMKQLSLGHCQLLPRQPINWPSLNYLQLYGVRLSDFFIRDISSGCPSIVMLELRRCIGFCRLDINSTRLRNLVIDSYLDSSDTMDGSALQIRAPNILSLQISGRYNKKIRVIDLSSLVDVKLKFCLLTKTEDAIQDYPNMLNELLQSLKHVRNLTMGSWCTQVLSVLGVKALPIPQSKCMRLTLDIWLDKWDLPGISSLLKSSPNLESLVVDMSSVNNQQFEEVKLDDEFSSSYDFEGKNYWTSTGMLTCLMKSVKIIKIIKIIGFAGERLEIKLVEFLLKNSMLLQKMIIHTNKANHDKQMKTFKPEELLKVATSLLCLPRSSSNSVILFS